MPISPHNVCMFYNAMTVPEIEDPKTREQRKPSAEPLRVWTDRGGRRCIAPPEFMICDWELRMWYEYTDPSEELIIRANQMAAWKEKNPNETYEQDPIEPDKRFKENRLGRNSG